MKKLSKKTLSSTFWHWYNGHATCFTYENMHTLGFINAMMPTIEELYDTKEERVEAIKTYRSFFNTEPQLGAIIIGICCGLEEARANGNEEVDTEMISGIRGGLMGPVAGIGDSIIVGTYIPILLGIALGLSTGGSPLGAIFYALAYIISITAFMKFVFNKGYELGGAAVDLIVGEHADAIKNSIILGGTIIVGAVAGSWVNITTAFSLTNSSGETYLNLQSILDGIYPNILSGIVIMFCYYLLAKKNISTVKVMLILLIVALLGCLVGIFDPGLSYAVS